MDTTRIVLSDEDAQEASAAVEHIQTTLTGALEIQCWGFEIVITDVDAIGLVTGYLNDTSD